MELFWVPKVGFRIISLRINILVRREKPTKIKYSDSKYFYWRPQILYGEIVIIISSKYSIKHSRIHLLKYYNLLVQLNVDISCDIARWTKSGVKLTELYELRKLHPESTT